MLKNGKIGANKIFVLCFSVPWFYLGCWCSSHDNTQPSHGGCYGWKWWCYAENKYNVWILNHLYSALSENLEKNHWSGFQDHFITYWLTNGGTRVTFYKISRFGWFLKTDFKCNTCFFFISTTFFFYKHHWASDLVKKISTS